MILKIQKGTIEKVVECEGYLRTRYAYHEDGERPAEVRPGEIAVGRGLHTLTRDLGMQELVTEGWKAVTIIEPRGSHWWGAFTLPEEPPNRMFVCNDKGDTIDRLNWG